MSLSPAAATTSTLAREVIPATERDLCAWCNLPATRNLDTYHDVACETHHALWFTGPNAATLCDCARCARVAASRPACEHASARATRIGTDTVASAWACDACDHLTPFTDADYAFANAWAWSPRTAW